MVERFDPRRLPPEWSASQTANESETYIGDPEFIVKCVEQWMENDRVATAKIAASVAAGASKENAENAAGKKSGASGSVYRVAVDGQSYVVKRVKVHPDLYIRHKSIILHELAVSIKLTTAVPDAVSRLIGAVYINDFPSKFLELYLIFEGPPGYDLFDYIRKLGETDIQLDNPIFAKIYCSLKAAQVAVNGAGYVHRDIKPENIFVEVDPADGMTFVRCKLIDMGLVMKAGSKVSRAGTPEYWPPHMANNAGYERVNGGIVKASHNDYSVDVIWRRVFLQQGPAPTCAAPVNEGVAGRPPLHPGKSKADGGRRYRKTRKNRSRRHT
jgi:serine/threonine protein kinase